MTAKYLQGFLLTGCACAVAALAIGLVAAAPGDSGDNGVGPPQRKPDQKEARPEKLNYFADDFQPFIKKHCFECHSGEEPESELRLDQADSEAKLREDRERWQKAIRMLRTRQMPPKDHRQPPEKEADAIVAWLDNALNYVDCSAPRDPGYVTLRRLNRVEYTNTVRDLLGVEIKVGQDFPADDVGYGFDNIGDVLTLPPLLMEKYLDAAERSAGEVLNVARPDSERTTYAAARLSTRGHTNRSGDTWWILSAGEVYARHNFSDSGEYVIRIRAEGDQAGDEPVKVGLNIDGRQVRTFEIKTEDRFEQLEYRLQVDRGARRVAAAFLNDYYQPNDRDPKNRDRNLCVRDIEIIGPIRDRPKTDNPVVQRVFFVRPDDKVKPREAAQRIFERLASRAYRRPATKDEVERLVQLAESRHKQKESFEEAIAFALQAILVSPKFLFKVELDPAAGDPQQVRWLNEHELASRLSYFLWSTMPDDELLKLAEDGQLRKNLEPQVRRMLADSKSRALADNFATQWLGLRSLDMMQPDGKLFPTFDDKLRGDMLRESVLFFDTIVREDHSVLELIDADYTFLNQRLARHYGIGDVQGDEFRRVPLVDSSRGGVMTQAAVLTVTSNPTRTSPVKRGKWILDNILAKPPPSPPANVPELDESKQAAESASLRKRLEIHREDARCAICHNDMDALGFAMENFDAVGAWRERDGRFAIEPAGEMPDGKKFSGPADLKRLLKTSRQEDFLRCLSEKMLTYAIGRGVEYYDRCVVDEIVAALKQNDMRFSVLAAEIIKSDPFQKRRARRK